MVKVDDNEQIIDFKPLEIEVKQPTQVLIPEKILKVDDEEDVEEIIIESTETDEYQAVVVNPIKAIVTVAEEDEEVVEDVPFMVIENVPIFPGCKGNNQELRNCFSNEISKFVLKRFNGELASDLGLQSGSIQRIFVVFKIDKYGKISNIEARAPHKKLQEEAIRVINLLPEMTPGKQRGKPVSVSYGLPIVFKIQ